MQGDTTERRLVHHFIITCAEVVHPFTNCTTCRLESTWKSWLRLAVQGDSGFIVVRNGRTVFRTKPEQHFWDCPLQFAAKPEYAQVCRAALLCAVCVCPHGALPVCGQIWA